MDALPHAPRPSMPLTDEPRHLAGLVAALAEIASRIEREADTHTAAALFLSGIRDHLAARRAVLSVPDDTGRDQQWFFAGLSNADIDWFHAHRPTSRDRDQCLSAGIVAGRSVSVPIAAVPGGWGLRPHPGVLAGSDAADAGGHSAVGRAAAASGDLLFAPLRGARGALLGLLVLDDGLAAMERSRATLAVLDLFVAQMARVLERRLFDRSTRESETRLRRAQEQLMQSDKLSAIGQLVSGVAHELNNPLSGVIGFAELLRAGETNPKSQKHLDRIHAEAVRCQKIVKNLLGFAHRHKPEKAAHVLNQVIAKVLDLRAYQLQVDGITVETRFAPDLPPTLLDENQIQQVVLNLINNAQQAMMAIADRPRRLTITTEARDGRIRATVSDTGTGIPPERLQQIFEPFYTTKEVGQGTGLGLSVSIGILKDHQGTLGVESVVGQGTSFTFDLPLVACAPAVADAPRPAAVSPAAPLRVLVVDDEPVLVELLSDLLRGVGHTVETARDGRAALALLRQRPFDVVLSDLKMPGLDGPGLYEAACRERPVLRDRFVFSTGDTVNPQSQSFLDSGRCPYLVKPFKLEAVLEAVARAGGRQAA